MSHGDGSFDTVPLTGKIVQCSAASESAFVQWIVP